MPERSWQAKSKPFEALVRYAGGMCPRLEVHQHTVERSQPSEATGADPSLSPRARIEHEVAAVEVLLLVGTHSLKYHMRQVPTAKGVHRLYEGSWSIFKISCGQKTG